MQLLSIVTFGLSRTAFDILTHKAKNSSLLPSHPCLTHPLRGKRQNFWMKLMPQKLEVWGYYTMKIA